jgi:hypothetical protein
VIEQPANIRIAALADPEQGRFASGGVLSRNQTEPGSEILRFPELAGISDRGDQRSRTNVPLRARTKTLFNRTRRSCSLWWPISRHEFDPTH